MDEWRDNALTADVDLPVDTVWPQVRASMARMTDELLEVDEDLLEVRTRLDDVELQVTAQPWGEDRTRLFVEAKKYMLSSPEASHQVMDRLLHDLAP